MRENPVKAKLAAGGASYGTMVFEFFTPGMPQILRVAGCEWAMFDMEHSGAGIETIKQQMALCRGIGLVPLVRVPATEYHFIARALDAGALGVMAPMVESVEQARALASATRYPPVGRRGAAFGVAHDDYLPGAPAEKILAANARTLTIAMIETPAGVANVEAIAAVDGIDVLWLGQFDLTNFMGIPGQFEHPDFLAAVDRIAAAARGRGLAAASATANRRMVADFRARGFRMMGWGLDHQVFQAALAEGIGVLQAG